MSMSGSLENRLAECLAARGMKKSELAFRLKMSRAYVTRLVRGDIAPSFESAIRIARYFGKPVEEIFLVDESPMSSSSKVPSRSNSHASSASSGNCETMPKKEK